MTELDASSELMNLVFLAIDHSIDSIKELDGAPFMPFVMTQGEGEGNNTLHRFVDEDLNRAVAGAHAHLRQAGGVVRGALAYDAYVTIGGERSDAVLLKAQEQGREHSLLFAQRYRPGSGPNGFATIGNVAFLELQERLF